MNSTKHKIVPEIVSKELQLKNIELANSVIVPLSLKPKAVDQSLSNQREKASTALLTLPHLQKYRNSKLSTAHTKELIPHSGQAFVEPIPPTNQCINYYP